MQTEQIDKIKKELLEEIPIFWRHLNYLKDTFDVSNHLWSIVDKRIKYNIPKNKVAPNFFVITFCGMKDCVYITLARLYDKNSASNTIQKLLGKCSKIVKHLVDNVTLQDQIKELNSKLTKDDTISEAINTIYERRNKFWAHNDKEYFSQLGQDKEHYLPNSSLTHLIDFTEETLKILMRTLSLTTDERPIYDRDLDNLFDESDTYMKHSRYITRYSSIEEDTLIVLGTFTVLWAQFEFDYCDNSASPSAIYARIDSFRPNEMQCSLCAEVRYEALSYIGNIDNILKAIYSQLNREHPDQIDRFKCYKERIKHFFESEEIDIGGCLLFIAISTTMK